MSDGLTIVAVKVLVVFALPILTDKRANIRLQYTYCVLKDYDKLPAGQSLKVQANTSLTVAELLK